MFLFSVVGSGKWRLSNWSGGCWALLGFFFAVSSAAWHTVPEKMIFGSGKSFLIVGEWRLLGFAGTGKLPGKKWFLGWENHFVKLESGGCGICCFFFCGVYIAACKIAGQGEWRLLGFAGISSFAVSTAVWQSAGEKNDFWVGQWFFWNWRVAIGNLLGFLLFCIVYCCLAECLGAGKSFCEIGEWRLLGFAGISSFAVSGQKMIFGSGKSRFWSDCWDLLGFLLFCVVYCSTKRIEQLLVLTAHMYTTSAKDLGLLEGHLGHVAIQTMDRNTVTLPPIIIWLLSKTNASTLQVWLILHHDCIGMKAWAPHRLPCICYPRNFAGFSLVNSGKASTNVS